MTDDSLPPGGRPPVPPDVAAGGSDGKERHRIGPARHDEVLPGGNPAGALITAGELARLLRAATQPGSGIPDTPLPVTLLDVRWRLSGPPGRDLYAAGHIPGAVFADLDRDLAAPHVPGGPGGRHPLPATGDFTAAMRRLGVSAARPVVVYDDADSSAAARAWWLLRYFGHPAVRVLDGGFRAWTAAGQPAAAGAGPGALTAGDFTARPGHLALLDADGAAGLARTGLLLDARAAQRYRGEAEPIDPVAGHIPGAVCAPSTGNVNPDGTLRTPAELAARFAALGAADGVPVAAYCGSGVTAAQEVLALMLAGIPAALYAGSWSHWITDPARPIATGPTP